MRRGTLPVVVLCLLSLAPGVTLGVEPDGPADVLRRYLQALKSGNFEEAFDLVSTGMRQGKSKEQYVKESQAVMGFADVKIFDFTVYPATIEGDKALVPNVLESQDRFVNTLGLTEHELYTLVREGGGWKVDAQTLVEPPDQAKWFGQKPGKEAKDAKADRPDDTAPH